MCVCFGAASVLYIDHVGCLRITTRRSSNFTLLLTNVVFLTSTADIYLDHGYKQDASACVQEALSIHPLSHLASFMVSLYCLHESVRQILNRLTAEGDGRGEGGHSVMGKALQKCLAPNTVSVEYWVWSTIFYQRRNTMIIHRDIFYVER